MQRLLHGTAAALSEMVTRRSIMSSTRYLALGASALLFCGCVAGSGPTEDDATGSGPLLGLPLPLPLPTGSPPTAAAQSASCAALNNYTAAIAEATIACTGTIGPDSFVVGSSGRLQRNFTQCSVSGSQSAQLRQTIDDLLGLQQRGNLVASSCFPNQWSTWRTNFLAAGNSTCPSWTIVSALGTATSVTVQTLIALLPVLGNLATGGLPKSILDLAKENFLYLVTLPLLTPPQPCGDAMSCAAECTGGLPGFYLGTQAGLILGDPCWWLSSTQYSSSSSDPFMQSGYYHPMSYYGDPPGDIYGHRNRVGEACSRWGGNYHYQAILKLDCVVPNDPNSPCSSVCDVP
jgi:hypothetical protein